MSGLYLTRLRPDQWGCGGARRAAQLVRDYAPSQVLSIYDEATYGGVSVGDRLLAAIWWRFKWPPAKRLREHFWGRRCRQLGMLRGDYRLALGRADAYWASRLASFGCRSLLLDDPIYFPLTLQAACAAGIPVTADVQNLESTVPGQCPAGHQLAALRLEIEALRRCEEAVCISCEEATVLRNLGVNARFKPYSPGPEVEAWLLGVRRAREPRGELLVLGSATNPPTRIGLEQVLAWWERGGTSTRASGQ